MSHHLFLICMQCVLSVMFHLTRRNTATRRKLPSFSAPQTSNPVGLTLSAQSWRAHHPSDVLPIAGPTVSLGRMKQAYLTLVGKHSSVLRNTLNIFCAKGDQKPLSTTFLLQALVLESLQDKRLCVCVFTRLFRNFTLACTTSVHLLLGDTTH